MKLNTTEEKEQQAIFQWAKDNTPKYPALNLLFHIPNEGKRTKAAGARLKRQGLRSGIPDICLPFPSSGYGCLFIELKVNYNITSKEQQEYINLINQSGGRAITVYFADNAIDIITAYLNNTIDQITTSDTYPERKQRINTRRYIGDCGKDCRECPQLNCLGRVCHK